jgi:hypothetical protein
MTIDTQSSKTSYQGNNAKEFPVPFPVFRAEHLHLYLDTALMQPGTYTVYGIGSENVRVMLNSPLPPGKLLTILRLVPLVQPTDLQNGGNFNADVIEYTYDYQEMQIQQLKEEIGRAIKIPVGGTEESMDEFISRLEEILALIEAAAGQIAGVGNDSLINVGDTDRTLQDKLEEIASVIDYGVTKDDDQDDTEGFHKAPEFTNIPQGTYSVTENILDKVFITLGNVDITGGDVDVSDLSNDDNNKYRKRVIQVIPRKFPDYDAVMTLLGGNVTSMSPQGMWYDNLCNLYIAYNTAASNTAKGVIAVYDDKYEYQRCFLIPDYTAESIVVKEEANGTYIYYRADQPSLHLKKARIDNIENMGLLTGINDMGIEVAANFSYFNGTWLIGSNALLQGGGNNRSRALYVYYDDNFTEKGFVYIPVNIIGFAAETGIGAPYFDIIPKLQGVALAGDTICFSHGPYWAPGLTPDSRGMGVSRHTAHGDLLSYEMIYSKDFFAYLNRNGYAAAMVEAEGCAWHPRKHALHSMISINSVTTEGAENSKLLIVSERDAYGTSFDKSAIAYHPTCFDRIENTVYPLAGDQILRNPVTGLPFTSQLEIITFVRTFGLTHFVYHPGFCQALTPFSVRTQDITGVIVITNASSMVLYMDFLSNESKRVRLVWTSDTDFTSWYSQYSTDSVNVSGQARINAVSNDQLYSFLMLRGTPQAAAGDMYIGGGQAGQKACVRHRFYAGTAANQDTGTEQIRLSHGVLTPVNTDAVNLGTGGQRWSNIYLINSPTVGSDKKLKDNITEIDPKILQAMSAVNFKSYRLKSAVKKKGKAARTHFGVVAQDVETAFKAYGLDAFKFGILGKDEILTETKDEQENTSVTPTGKYELNARYEELLILEAAALRKRVEALEDRLALMETQS